MHAIGVRVCMAQSQISLPWQGGGINGPANVVEPRHAPSHTRLPVDRMLCACRSRAGAQHAARRASYSCTCSHIFWKRACAQGWPSPRNAARPSPTLVRKRHTVPWPLTRVSNTSQHPCANGDLLLLLQPYGTVPRPGGQVLHIRLVTGAHHLLQFLPQAFQHSMDACRPVDHQATGEGPSHAHGPHTSLPHRLPASRAPSACP
jgi:hypothetical protein